MECGCGYFFLFMRKTAYEMRISDWRSDVYSSDRDAAGRGADATCAGAGADAPVPPSPMSLAMMRATSALTGADTFVAAASGRADAAPALLPAIRPRALIAVIEKFVSPRVKRGRNRSEEQTSELQSIMRTSYAVFCLKKTN